MCVMITIARATIFMRLQARLWESGYFKLNLMTFYAVDALDRTAVSVTLNVSVYIANARKGVAEWVICVTRRFKRETSSS
jgi:methionine salvage enolase-phosphatase E1